MDLERLQRDQTDELLMTLRAVPDLEDRIRAIDVAREHTVTITQAALLDLRTDTIRDMLATMSKAEVGRRLGVSRGRIGQIVGADPARYRRASVSTGDTPGASGA